MINQAQLAAFRCPEEYCSYDISEQLSSESGFFRFDEDIICFGLCAGEVRPDVNGELFDAQRHVHLDETGPMFPFDPATVVDNLRLERYVSDAKSIKERLVHGIYYLIRPLLPVSVRKHIQRLRLKKAQLTAFPDWPVDCTADLLLEKTLALSMKARGVKCVPFVWFWPEGAPSCAIITHDVEAPAGLRFCSTLMDIDDQFGIKSSFQLVPEKRYVLTNSIVDEIRGRGFEANIHDLNHDGRLFSDREIFLERVKKINAYGRRFAIDGFRSGGLYRNIEWYGDFDFRYDMSVPSAGRLEAQAGGACTVRPYFINDMVELPVTTTQDYSLFHILNDYSTDLWKREIDALIARNGLISFIVHPDYLIEKRARKTYEELLAHLSELRSARKLSIALPGEVAQWWRQRNAMSVEASGSDWNVVGVGADKARVAYACLEGEKLSYTFELKTLVQKKAAQPLAG